jgi:hypothetical protein
MDKGLMGLPDQVAAGVICQSSLTTSKRSKGDRIAGFRRLFALISTLPDRHAKKGG